MRNRLKYTRKENIFEVELYFSIDLNFEGRHLDELYEIKDMNTIIQRETLCDYYYSICYEPLDGSLNYDEYPPTNFEKIFKINMPKEF